MEMFIGFILGCVVIVCGFGLCANAYKMGVEAGKRMINNADK